MNKKQKIALWMGVGMVTVMGLIAPCMVHGRSREETESEGLQAEGHE